jgi:hypothetical protein
MNCKECGTTLIRLPKRFYCPNCPEYWIFKRGKLRKDETLWDLVQKWWTVKMLNITARYLLEYGGI